MIIPDEKLGKALQVLYNVWFDKWRRRTREMTPDLWTQCYDELLHITNQGDYEVVQRIGNALAMELDARWRGHYPDWKEEFKHDQTA